MHTSLVICFTHFLVFKKVATVEKEVDGATYTFDQFIGDLGERKEKKKGEIIYGNIFLKNKLFMYLPYIFL
jgi:formylmethanofuran dehydrogenase, subunit C (EC 1.2.99.5)